MTENEKSKKPISYVSTVLITAVLTLLLAGGGAYFMGFLGGTAIEAPPADSNPERKIAYWRAPMNPTEIYDKPGKSAMGMDLVPVYEDEIGTTSSDGKKERKIAYWRAPMNPTEIYDKPGKSAMGMDLVPVYEDEIIGGVEISIDPVTQQNMGVRTAVVEKGALTRDIRTYGHVTYDETRTVHISPKFNGWIEKLYVDFTGQPVEQGQPLFEIYSPELLAAQEEYLAAHRNLGRMAPGGSRELLASAQRRLMYFDVPESEIKEIETTGKVRKTLMIRSPSGGIITEKNVLEGTFVKAGTILYTVADLSRVWVEAHVYEYELPWIEEGQDAEMTLPYLPGKVFTGKVAYIYPYLQRKTRDIRIKLEFPNPDLALKPDMYANVSIKSIQKGEGTVIPQEAVIRSGERNVVFVVREEGKFTPRDVTLGYSLDDMVQILAGIAPGDIIVTSGQFLLDSESKLKEAVQKMMEAKRAPAEPKKETLEEDDFFKELEEDDFFEDIE